MKNPLRATAAAAFLLMLGAASAAAQTQLKAEPRHVTVSGHAEVKIRPDEVVFDVTVQHFGKDLKQAKTLTDEKLRGLTDLVKRYGVAESDTQTDYVKLEPRFKGNDDTRAFLGYWVRKDLVFTLRDVSRAEGLLSALMDFGVWRINSITFQTSQMRKYRDQAREMAMKAAQEKAAALAAAVGQKIGRAYSIEEDFDRAGGLSQNAMANNSVRVERDGDGSSEGTLSIGMISVSATVSVKFELD
jgi:uncharacterized protein YggE